MVRRNGCSFEFVVFFGQSRSEKHHFYHKFLCNKQTDYMFSMDRKSDNLYWEKQLEKKNKFKSYFYFLFLANLRRKFFYSHCTNFRWTAQKYKLMEQFIEKSNETSTLDRHGIQSKISVYLTTEPRTVFRIFS